MTRIAPLAALSLALLAMPASAKLTAVEQRMAANVDADQDWSVALLERMVNQNSGTRNKEGVIKVAQMVRPELEALGFTVVWKPMDAIDRAGHLFATRKGKAGTTKMLLIGHLDTVFEPDQPFQKFERTGDMAKGPGAGDNKGGVVVMLAALRAMKAAGTLDGANIEVALTGDEESVGEPVEAARADLIAAGKRADVALDFEGLAQIDGVDQGSIARRSSNSYTIRTTGRTGHSSGIFGSVGDGAIYEMARIISSFRKDLPEPNLTFNIGLVAGGASATLSENEASVSAQGKTNIIPAAAVATGDFRTLSAEQTARVRAKMEAIVAGPHAPGTGATITFKESYPPMPPTPGNHALLEKMNVINADLGLARMPALDPLRRGAGDISFVAADTDGLIGLGTASDGDHTPAEVVDLASMPRQAKRAALLMTRLSKEKGRKP
jgi:glutamate carboxypeptidase